MNRESLHMVLAALLLNLAQPTWAQMRAGPAPLITPAAVARVPPAPAVVTTWASAMEAFFMTPGADPMTLGPVVAALGRLDAGDSAVAAALQPLAVQAQAAFGKLAEAHRKAEAAGQPASMNLALKLAYLDGLFAAHLTPAQRPLAQAAAIAARRSLPAAEVAAFHAKVLDTVAAFKLGIPQNTEIPTPAAGASVEPDWTQDHKAPAEATLKPHAPLSILVRKPAVAAVTQTFFENYRLIADWPKFVEAQRKILAPEVTVVVDDHEGRTTYRGTEGYFQSLAEWGAKFETGPDFRTERKELGNTYALYRLHGTLRFKQPIKGKTQVVDTGHSWEERLWVDEQGRIVTINVAMNLFKPDADTPAPERAPNWERRAKDALYSLGYNARNVADGMLAMLESLLDVLIAVSGVILLGVAALMIIGTVINYPAVAIALVALALVLAQYRDRS